MDASEPLPLHVQLKNLLLAEILCGRYGSDGRLPTEHELCREHGISRTPVHRALSELAEDGVVLRRRRLGSFVNPHWIQSNREVPELRVVLPEGPWEDLVRRAVPDHVALSIAKVTLPDLHHTLTHAVAEGRAPDVALLDSVWVPEFGAAGFLHPLDELDPEWVAREYEPDFLEPFVTAHRDGCGRPIAVQAEVDLAGMWYRRSHLAEVGHTLPTSWRELVTVAEKLRVRLRRPPVVLPGGSRAGESATYCLTGLLASNGATVLSEDTVTVDSPPARQALRFLRNLVERHLVPADAVGYEWDHAIRRLGQGQASIAFGGSYEGPVLAAAAGIERDAVWDEFAFTAIPAGPHGRAAALAGGMAYGVFRQAADPKLAMHLVESILSTDALAYMARRTAQIPSRRTAADLVAGHSEFLRTTTDMLHHAVVRPATRYHARLSAQLQALLESVITGAFTPATACRRAAEAISAITGHPVARHRR